MLRRVGLSIAILACLASVATATPTIVIGANGPYTSGGPNATIPINVSGGDALSGVVFIIEISQGGIFPAAGSPTIASVDITGPGTIFNPNHLAPSIQFSNRATNITVANVGGSGGPDVWTPASGTPIKTKENFLTTSGTVVGTGLLGNLVISLAGAAPGLYDLKIKTMVTSGGGGNTMSFTGFTAAQVSFTNGTIEIVPEPSSVVLGLFAAAGLAAVAIRKRRARRAA